MKRVTRARAHVDRVPCPWMIRRFVDGDAELPFVRDAGVMERSRREDATPDASRLACGA